MAQVEININGKNYRIACEDGQESRIASLASMVDSHIKDLVEQIGQIGDTRLLVMASLLIADELVDLREIEGEVAAEGGGAPLGESEEKIAAALDAMAGRIESIADQLERA
ncbi:cell division protein ZapA [Nisaea acidiphila]|uniref:Cell division protein ZapA n=1 Tax=Nisaea acidiphila TaxID=1862145 RepID=A0A9J7AZP9_9PROT|nr:cell division protein ZapA [Nisaea acidiphila]UUX51724.1 cell division protein ZapA [Nisaea acidiphila]